MTPRLFHRPRRLPAWRAVVSVVRPLGVPRDVEVAPAGVRQPLATRGVHAVLVVVTSRGARILERAVTLAQLHAKRRELEQVLDVFDPPAPATSAPTLRLVRGDDPDDAPSR